MAIQPTRADDNNLQQNIRRRDNEEKLEKKQISGAMPPAFLQEQQQQEQGTNYIDEQKFWEQKQLQEEGMKGKNFDMNRREEGTSRQLYNAEELPKQHRDSFKERSRENALQFAEQQQQQQFNQEPLQTNFIDEKQWEQQAGLPALDNNDNFQQQQQLNQKQEIHLPFGQKDEREELSNEFPSQDAILAAKQQQRAGANFDNNNDFAQQQQDQQQFASEAHFPEQQKRAAEVPQAEDLLRQNSGTVRIGEGQQEQREATTNSPVNFNFHIVGTDGRNHQVTLPSNTMLSWLVERYGGKGIEMERLGGKRWSGEDLSTTTLVNAGIHNNSSIRLIGNDE